MGFFRTLQHLEQLIQFRSHDNLRTAVFASAFGCFVIIDRHIFTTSARLYLQRIHSIVLNQDTDNRGSTNHAQIQIVLKLYRVDRLVIRMPLNEYVDIRLLVQNLG